MAGRVIQGCFPGGRPLPAAPGGAGPAAPGHGARRSFPVDPVRLGLARAGGTPLPRTLLAKMETAFGADFSAVRVHVGPQAAQLGALAFTVGTDIYFAPGQYRPDSSHGQHLLGHELAHVVQQRQGRVRAPDGGVSVVQDPVLEAEADRLGLRAALHRAPPAATVQRPTVQRPTVQRATVQRATVQRATVQRATVQRAATHPAWGRPGAIQRMEQSNPSNYVTRQFYESKKRALKKFVSGVFEKRFLPEDEGVRGIVENPKLTALRQHEGFMALSQTTPQLERILTAWQEMKTTGRVRKTDPGVYKMMSGAELQTEITDRLCLCRPDDGGSTPYLVCPAAEARTGDLSHAEVADGTFLFVIRTDMRDVVLVARENRDANIGHTSLSRDAFVLYAGTVTFSGGALVQWDNNTGHYHTKPFHKGQAQGPRTLDGAAPMLPVDKFVVYFA
ncbi:eCIS core domain-containing protein [Azospirillum sp. ST 5-10]|uniref:eCIS core domain-containing protein n=1 Tax=unclassified Azospirillum TaxID=2630922 RepID=UPI003F4A21D1